MKGKKVINSKFDEKSIVISYCPLQNKFEVGYQATKNDPEWIYNISDLFTSTNTFKFIGDFISRLSEYRTAKGSALSDEEQGLIAERINGVVNLKSHTLERGAPFDRGACRCSLFRPQDALATSPVT